MRKLIIFDNKLLLVLVPTVISFGLLFTIFSNQAFAAESQSSTSLDRANIQFSDIDKIRQQNPTIVLQDNETIMPNSADYNPEDNVISIDDINAVVFHIPVINTSKDLDKHYNLTRAQDAEIIVNVPLGFDIVSLQNMESNDDMEYDFDEVNHSVIWHVSSLENEKVYDYTLTLRPAVDIKFIYDDENIPLSVACSIRYMENGKSLNSPDITSSNPDDKNNSKEINVSETFPFTINNVIEESRVVYNGELLISHFLNNSQNQIIGNDGLSANKIFNFTLTLVPPINFTNVFPSKINAHIYDKKTENRTTQTLEVKKIYDKYMINFALSHNQDINFVGIPSSCTYEVTASASADTTFSNNVGVISNNNKVEIYNGSTNDLTLRNEVRPTPENGNKLFEYEVMIMKGYNILGSIPHQYSISLDSPIPLDPNRLSTYDLHNVTLTSTDNGRYRYMGTINFLDNYDGTLSAYMPLVHDELAVINDLTTNTSMIVTQAPYMDYATSVIAESGKESYTANTLIFQGIFNEENKHLKGNFINVHTNGVINNGNDPGYNNPGNLGSLDIQIQDGDDGFIDDGYDMNSFEQNNGTVGDGTIFTPQINLGGDTERHLETYDDMGNIAERVDDSILNTEGPIIDTLPLAPQETFIEDIIPMDNAITEIENPIDNIPNTENDGANIPLNDPAEIKPLDNSSSHSSSDSLSQSNSSSLSFDAGDNILYSEDGIAPFSINAGREIPWWMWFILIGGGTCISTIIWFILRPRMI